MSESSKNSGPQKWWQWVLIYPTLFMSVPAAVPTVMEIMQSADVGVEFGDSALALRQDDLWKKNLSCINAPQKPLVTANNTKVSATICKTGDVLVRVFTPQGSEGYQWVGVNDVVVEKASFDGIFRTAYAADGGNYQKIAAATNAVLCQKFLGSGKVLRRISIAGQRCVDETINTYTGRVINKKEAPCNASC